MENCGFKFKWRTGLRVCVDKVPKLKGYRKSPKFGIAKNKTKPKNSFSGQWGEKQQGYHLNLPVRQPVPLCAAVSLGYAYLFDCRTAIKLNCCQWALMPYINERVCLTPPEDGWRKCQDSFVIKDFLGRHWNLLALGGTEKQDSENIMHQCGFKMTHSCTCFIFWGPKF